MTLQRLFIYMTVFFFLTSTGLLILNNVTLKEKHEIVQAHISDKAEFVREKNRQGNIISRQQQTIMSQKSAIESGRIRESELEVNNIRLLQSYVRIEEQARNLEKIVAHYKAGFNILPVLVPGNGNKTDTIPCLELPAQFNYDDEYISMYGDVTRKGVIFPPNGILVLSYPKFTIGYQDKHDSKFRNLFSQPRPVVIYENENPYYITLDMSNVVVPPKPRKWYQTTMAKLIYGAIIYETTRQFINN